MATKRILTAEQRAKQVIRQRRWRAANLEQVRAAGRAYSKSHREQARAWDAKPENRAKKNARTAERYQEIKAATDPDVLRAKWQDYYSRNPQAAIDRTKRWQVNNPEKYAAYLLATKDQRAQTGKQWQKDNPERVAAKTRRWQAAHPDAWREYRKANPDTMRAIKNTRRARERDAEGRHTAAELRALMVKQNGKCVYCGTDITKKYAADHIVSLSRGGTNWIANMQLLCVSCNSRKWAMDAEKFIQRRSIT